MSSKIVPFDKSVRLLLALSENRFFSKHFCGPHSPAISAAPLPCIVFSKSDKVLSVRRALKFLF